MAKPFLNNEKIQEYLDVNIEGYKIISDYTDQNSEIVLQCPELHPIKTTWRKFKQRKVKCAVCHSSKEDRIKRGKKRKTHEQFLKEVYDLMGSSYVVLGEYIGSTSKLEIKHLVCDHVWEVEANSFLKGTGCPYCSAKTHEQFLKEVNDIHGDVYTYLTRFKNSTERMVIQHKECEYTWSVLPGYLLDKRRLGRVYCPNCGSVRSKGELTISGLLTDFNIKYESEYTFSDCVYESLLRFDFAIFNDFNELKFLIEYDGEQHFFPVDFAGKGEEWAEEQFKETQKRDSIKNDYCNDNGITLYRIPYWMIDDIDEIISDVSNNKQIKVDENYLVV